MRNSNGSWTLCTLTFHLIDYKSESCKKKKNHHLPFLSGPVKLPSLIQPRDACGLRALGFCILGDTRVVSQ